MSIQHTAWACYGRPIKNLGIAEDQDHADAILKAANIPCVIVRWGSAFTGVGGYLIAFKTHLTEVDFGDAGGCEPIAKTFTDAPSMGRCIDKALAALQATSDQPTTWYVGGSTW